MDLYEIVRFLHVAAAVALLSGSVVGSPAVRAAVRRAHTTQEMRAYLAVGRPLLMLEPGAAMGVLATGVYLTSVAGFWAVGWVQVAVLFWIVNAAVAGVMVKPLISRVAVAAAAADGPIAEQLDTLRRSARWSVGGDLLLANDAAMLYLMAMKPDLVGSFLVVGIVNLSVATARAFGHGGRSRVGANGSSPVARPR